MNKPDYVTMEVTQQGIGDYPKEHMDRHRRRATYVKDRLEHELEKLQDSSHEYYEDGHIKIHVTYTIPAPEAEE